jgi:tellurite resistance protein
MNDAIRRTPVSLFAMVLGIADLGLGWRVAARAWAVPALIGESLLAVAALVWVLLLLYIGKWGLHRDAASCSSAPPCCPGWRSNP